MTPSHSDTDDDFRIGVPTLGSRRPTPPEVPISEVEPEGEPELRAGDPELGRPAQIPKNLAELTEADHRNLREAEEAQALLELAEAEEMLASNPEISWLGWFTHPLSVAFLLGSIGALGLFLYSQTLSILASLKDQPDLLRYLGYVGLGICAAAVLYAMARLGFLYIRLQRNRQIRLAGLEELQSRTRLRWLAQAKAAEAKVQTELYLRNFPMTTARERKRLERAGFTPLAILDLEKVREELLDASKFTTTVEWFERFRIGFQSRLDEAAETRVKYWAKRTGLITALAPNALIDSAATMYFGFAMLSELCTVYNLRAGRTGTAVLLGRVFFNSYLAGQINEWEKLTEEQLNLLTSHGGPLYELTASRVFSKVGAKAASGMLNYFLVGRLGRYTCRLLRPVA